MNRTLDFSIQREMEEGDPTVLRDTPEDRVANVIIHKIL